MTTLQDMAHLHESTVKLVAVPDRSPPSWVRKGRRKGSPPNKISYLQVHPLVLNEAKRIIAEGSYTKIQIINDGSVMVR